MARASLNLSAQVTKNSIYFCENVNQNIFLDLYAIVLYPISNIRFLSVTQDFRWVFKKLSSIIFITVLSKCMVPIADLSREYTILVIYWKTCSYLHAI